MHRKKLMMNIAVFAMQFGLLAGIAVLEYLSEYRAGVMHHLYVKKISLMNSLYSADNMHLHIAALILAATGVLTACKAFRLSSKSLSTVWSVALCLAAALLFATGYLSEWNSYPYLLMTTQTVVALECLRFIASGMIDRHSLKVVHNLSQQIEQR